MTFDLWPWLLTLWLWKFVAHRVHVVIVRIKSERNRTIPDWVIDNMKKKFCRRYATLRHCALTPWPWKFVIDRRCHVIIGLWTKLVNPRRRPKSTAWYNLSVATNTMERGLGLLRPVHTDRQKRHHAYISIHWKASHVYVIVCMYVCMYTRIYNARVLTA